MTPPDSGEMIRRCPHGCSSRAACPYCSPSPGAHGTVTPLTDSGEREVCKHGGPSGDCAVCVAEREYRVSVPLPLAQRILAALELAASAWDAEPESAQLASELRAAVERKP